MIEETITLILQLQDLLKNYHLVSPDKNKGPFGELEIRELIREAEEGISKLDNDPEDPDIISILDLYKINSKLLTFISTYN